ncbi:MAG TPA: hypothetical protein DCK99_10690 [Blastocatellia bacterium]|nr:hypothetical protein [Blastocatellia bacterium]
MSRPRFVVVALIILAAAASRLIPHPPNLASITAVALFGGAYLNDKRLALLVPVAALLLSDLVLGFYSHMEIVYGSFLIVVCIGFWLQRRRSALRIAGAALASSVIFFVVTNFGVWAFEPLYSKTAAGLLACYVAAIPFFQNTLVGDAVYTTVLFGGFALAEKLFPILRERDMAHAQA